MNIFSLAIGYFSHFLCWIIKCTDFHRLFKYIIRLQNRKLLNLMQTSKHSAKTVNHIEDTEPQSLFSCNLFIGDTEFGKKIDGFFDSGKYIIISSIMMIGTLFGDDLRQILFDPSADIPFSIANLVLMVIYSFEIVMLSLVRKDYFLKYYFWLDFFSTITMSFDLIWVTQFISGGGKNAANIAQISKASRAARLGARTMKLIRIIRMIKLMKIYKSFSKKLAAGSQSNLMKKKKSEKLNNIKSKISSFKNFDRNPSKRWTLIKQTCLLTNQQYKHRQISINCLPQGASEEKAEDHFSRNKIGIKSDIIRQLPSQIDSIKEEESEHVQVKGVTQEEIMTSKGIVKGNSENEIIFQETKVGNKIQDQIQKNIILMIILILISIPILDADTWFSPISIYDKSINQLNFFATSYPTAFDAEAQIFISSSLNNLNPLIYFNIPINSTCCTFPDNYTTYIPLMSQQIAGMRDADLNSVSGQNYTISYDISAYNIRASELNIGRTLFVCVLLIITTMLFSNDVEIAAIQPLEDMFSTVRKIAIHPLNALREIQEKNMCMEAFEKDFDSNQAQNEPKLLQNTIVKIGSLLAVGFGEAGTEIISKVIEDPSIINVMIPGQKIMAIFGFCDIRNFTDATEILEADVMVFVNEIAEICHRVVHQHLGSPNKNIGDAFLLVWKFSQEDVTVKELCDKETEVSLKITKKVRQVADLAVLSFVRMIAEISKSHLLQKYKNNKELQKRIPNYKGVKMGFGLHVGWAIEGPIGSEYKIDASYLSPHVHMASRLQAATKAYGVPMLITGDVYDLMSEENKQYLRQVDRVKVSEEEQASMSLYTVDICAQHLIDTVGIKKLKPLKELEKRKAKVCQNINRRKLQEDITKSLVTAKMWNEEDIRMMREPYSKKFYEEWNLAFSAYQEGNWTAALEHFTRTKYLAPEETDGPSESFINFIQNLQGKSPKGWDGLREFD